MKDISMKNSTSKYAKATGKLILNKETVELIKNNSIKMENVIETAKNAGICFAKKTSDFVVHAHNSSLDYVDISCDLTDSELIITSIVKAVCKSGIESNALASVSIALVNAADMLKGICKDIEISNIKIVESTGKAKDFIRKRVNPVKAALLIVSNAKFNNKKEDKTSPFIVDFLKQHQINTKLTEIHEENLELLKKKILQLQKENYQLIILSGSSSLNTQGVSAQAVKETITRTLPGITEGIRKFGKDRTPYSMFSEEVCGVLDKTIVLNISGSTTGAVESLSAIFPGLLKGFSMMKKVD